MNRITEIFKNCNQIKEQTEIFFRRYIGCELLRKCRITKIDERARNGDIQSCNPVSRLIGDAEDSKLLKACVSAKQILLDKIAQVFYDESPYRMFKDGTFPHPYKKDTYYRFDRMGSANWERLQTGTAANVINDIVSQTEDGQTAALVIDDTLYMRRRGKGTELCAQVFDHTDGKLRTGYRMITGGWTNGETFIPFEQHLLTTNKKELMVGPDEQVDGRTRKGMRRSEARRAGTDIAVGMVDTAKEAGIPFRYVMFDTWFSNPAQVVAIKEKGADVIAMVKKGKAKYLWADPSTKKELNLNVKQIYSMNKKRPGRAKYLFSVEVKARGQDGKLVSVRLIYARNRNKKGDWVCFICTDMGLNEEEALRLYSMRWSIETYFKTCKSYLKLRTECHSTSYDAITSHMVVAALRYMMLSVEKFRSSDTRSLLDFFYDIKREVANDLLAPQLACILDTMLDIVSECLRPDEDTIDSIVLNFMRRLPPLWHERLMIPPVAA